jgi:hypothetical protein
MKREPSWFWHRLRAMSGEEIAARIRLSLKKRTWRDRTSWDAPQPKRSPEDKWNLSPLAEIPREERTAILAEAERCLNGDYCLLNLSFHESPIDWHRDPQTGTRAPLQFGFDLDFLDANLVGNIKYLWEKNRHHHLTVLALAYVLSNDGRFAHEVSSQLGSWLKQNPFPIGVNWASSLEAGVRLISWTWIARLLRGSSVHSPLFGKEGSLWPAIYWHQWMIEQHHSHGSSANNHLVGEMAGLFIAASVWPVFEESERWRELARRKLEREIIRQTFPSGINRELAFDYHIFTTELFQLALMEAERRGAPFSSEYRARLTRMIEVVPLLTDVGGNLPRYGDGDDSKAVPAVLLGAKTPRATHATSTRGCVALEDAGLYVLASQRNTPHEVFVLDDTGPLGYLSTAAHAHADALSFTLSVAGKPILVDPGTFDYLADELWRRYFRSTRAHNTVVMDALDQSTQAGPFLWTQKARTSVQSWTAMNSGAKLEAAHDGYKRVGVIHQRSLELHGNMLTIVDELQGTGGHEATLCFHLAPECNVERTSPLVLRISREGVELRLTLPDGLAVELVHGGSKAGWYSPHYGVKQPTWSILAQARCSLPCRFETTIKVTP